MGPLNYATGRLTEAYTANTETFYSYDKRGRIGTEWQCTPLDCGSGFMTFAYDHNHLGQQTSLSYDGGFTLSQAYDGADRIDQLTNSYTDQYNPATLATVSEFWPPGEPKQISYGNGLDEARSYNPRLQATQMRVYNSQSDVLNETFDWASGQDNGNLSTWDASGSGTPSFNRSYTYGPVNRLASMSSPADPSGCLGLSWTYDAWGNRKTQDVTSGTCVISSLGFNANNQIDSPSGFQYDAAGNLTGDGTHSYSYDAENRLTQVDGGGTASYVYDANGQRVEKITAAGQVHYFYDEDGNVIVERDQSGATLKDYVYMGGQHVAEFSGGQTYFVHTDDLGSTRTVTDYAGNVTDALDYLPFGEQVAGDTFTTHKFTGKERDSESGLDDFGARYYSSQYGRFMIPDWAAKATAVPYADFGDPQTLNLYAYVRNNPLSNVDADGHACSGILGNMGSGFCTRADEYGRFDAISSIQSQTRFFAAADAVSQALADVAVPMASGFVVSQQTANFLEGVGQNLEKLNQQEMSAIQNGTLSGPNLDQQLVHNEQSAVQTQLDNLQQSNPGAYSQTIKEINGALNPGTVGRVASTIFSTDKAYASVLNGVRKGLGRNIDFSKQSDREAIGNALIKHVRETGGCDVNGKKQPGCE